MVKAHYQTSFRAKSSFTNGIHIKNHLVFLAVYSVVIKSVIVFADYATFY